MRLALLFLISGCIARPPSVFSVEVQAPYRRHVSVPRLERSDAPAFEKINQRLMALVEEWKCPDGSDGQSAYLVDGRIALRRGKIVGIDLSFDAMCSGWAHPSSGHEGLFFHATAGDQLKDVIARMPSARTRSRRRRSSSSPPRPDSSRRRACPTPCAHA